MRVHVRALAHVLTAGRVVAPLAVLRLTAELAATNAGTARRVGAGVVSDDGAVRGSCDGRCGDPGGTCDREGERDERFESAVGCHFGCHLPGWSDVLSVGRAGLEPAA